MENISFIVQGPVLKDTDVKAGAFSTFEVLKSIRTFYPGAEVILSTWNGTDVEGLDFDKLVLSDDPGSIIVPGIKNPYNHNRLIISSINGIKQATNDIVVKTRTDIVFTNNNIFDILKYVSPTNGKYSIFSHYILATNYYVRNPFKLHFLFHSSDIVLIGKKTDLTLFFDAPIVYKEDMVMDNKRIKMVAEQYLTLNSIKNAKNETYDFEDLNSTNFLYFLKSEKYLFNSFNFVSLEDIGVRFPTRLRYAYRPDANYSIREINILSRRYRKTDELDAYSYLRALKYVYVRGKVFIKIKLFGG